MGVERNKRLASQIRREYRRKFKKDGFLICGICGERIEDITDMRADHIIPLSRGGLDKSDNFQPAHSECDKQKGNNYGPAIKDIALYEYMKWGEWKV